VAAVFAGGFGEAEVADARAGGVAALVGLGSLFKVFWMDVMYEGGRTYYG